MQQNKELMQSEARLRYADQIIALRTRPAEKKSSKQWTDLALEFLTKNGPQPRRVGLLLEVFDKMRFLKIPACLVCNEAREDFWLALEDNNTIEALAFDIALFSSERLTAFIKNNSKIVKIEIEGPILFSEQDINDIVEALSINKSLFSVTVNSYGINLPRNTYCERNFQRRMVLPLALLVLVLLNGTEPTVDENDSEQPGFPSGMPAELIIKMMMMASLEPNRSYCNKLLNWISENPPKGPKQEVVQERVNTGCCVS